MVEDAPCYEAAAVCNAVLIETSILQAEPRSGTTLQDRTKITDESFSWNYIWEQFLCKSLYDHKCSMDCICI